MAPRVQTAGNPSLRNRNRVTNKTRLKVIKGNIDADPIVLDEDEERARVVSTAGVDAEDANEHHLQAVLSAASHRATLAQKAAAATKGEHKEISKPSTAFIPVPDAAGIVENVDQLYPPGRWVEYHSYIKFSDTVDESLLYGLNDGFTYFMDERDAEWLKRNNQEARGEGTSSQTSASSAGTTTRSARSTKAKGKEIETNTPVVMNEDEFELLMGLFEKITHDNTPFLHVSFQQQQGSCIPPFSDYHDTFANELPKYLFARYMHPPILPPPSTLLRMAKTVYPYWRERKIEREGCRIIPGLNFDESDAKNESYICFRRRDTKAIRKTRAAQVSSAEKLLRLKAELGHAAELARTVLAREVHKKEAHLEAKEVWEKRLAFLELKRRHPALAGKDDEDVLVEKERPPKKPKTESAPTIRIRSRPVDPSASPAPPEPQIRPRDRHASIQSTMEIIVKRMKEADHGWDDQIDSSYQQPPISLPDRHFRPMSEDSNSSSDAAAPGRPRQPLCLRLRRGRGGRMLIDRRRSRLQSEEEAFAMSRRSLDAIRHADEARKGPRNFEAPELKERLLEEDRLSRLMGRWRFDTSSESTGTDEEDRVLFDDYNPKHLRIQAMLLSNSEPLVTDHRLYLFDPQSGTHVFVNPPKQQLYSTPVSQRDGASHQQARPNVAPGNQTQVPHQSAPPQAVPVAQAVSSIPNPLQSPIKISASAAAQHTRSSSNGPQRPPSSASVSSAQTNGNPSLSSPATQTIVAQANGLPSQSSPVNGIPQLPVASVSTMSNGNANGLMNGINGTNGLLPGLPANLSNLTPAQQQALLLHQRQQSMQKIYANYAANIQRNGQAPFGQSMMGGTAADNMSAAATLASAVNNANLLAPVNMNLKLPTQRQMQWANPAHRSQSAQGGMMNGSDTNAAMQALQGMQNMQQLAGLGLLQSHTLSAVNGHGNSHLSPQRTAHSPPNGLSHALSLSPHLGSPAQSQARVSPVRNMQTPVPPSPSPLLQHQVPNLVGGLPSQNQGF
ncbi:hypothetical protein ACEPAG_3190 [Sanghuangporus baumii]